MATTGILDLIGNTPLMKLTRATAGLNVNVFAKCEFMNPSGSVKDRMALKMITEAEREGKLRHGGMIVDSSTGNAGPALALVGRAKGYKVRIYIPAKWGSGTYGVQERIKILKCFGAEVVEVPPPPQEVADLAKGLGESGLGSATELAGRKACYDLEKQNPSVWWARQVANPMNPEGHRVIGREILKQIEKVDAWVASVGSGGTLLGVTDVLKEVNPSLKVFAVQPEDAQLLEWTKRNLQDPVYAKLGLPKEKVIKNTVLERGIFDDIILVKNEEARDMANKLGQEEGLFCGMSSGANVFAAVEVAKKMPTDANVVTVLVDRRDRYLGEWPHEHYVV